MYMIPLTTDPNNRFRCVVPVDGENLFLEFFARYNPIAEYWMMDISDDYGNCLASCIPLITGQYPVANLLEQYNFLGIGAAVMVPVGMAKGEPAADNLGSEFVMVWSDTR